MQAASGEAAVAAALGGACLAEGEVVMARQRIECAPNRKGRQALEDLVERGVKEHPGVPQAELFEHLEAMRVAEGGNFIGLGKDGFLIRCAEALRDLRTAGRVARGPVGTPPRWWPVTEGGEA